MRMQNPRLNWGERLRGNAGGIILKIHRMKCGGKVVFSPQNHKQFITAF